MREQDHGQCITDESLTEYLEGSLDPAVKAASEVHLLRCDACRNQLAFFMRVLDPQVTKEEDEKLEVVSAQWDKSGYKKPYPNRFSGLFTACLAVAVVALIVVSLWVVNRRTEVQSAGDVVMLLLTEDRPFEARMAGEPHRSIVRTRGSEDPRVSYTLLEGEMTRLSASSHEMGQFYLIQKDFNRATPYLSMAERQVGANAAVHNDLGVAYLESGNAALLEKAGSEFLHALQRDRAFAEAVFNLGLYYERTNVPSQAETQWKRYLELDSESNWAAEARERLQGLSR